MDAGRRSDATAIATTSSVFIKKHVPALYKKIFGLMVSPSSSDESLECCLILSRRIHTKSLDRC